MFPEEGQAIAAKILLLFCIAFTMCFARARASEPTQSPVTVYERTQF